VTIKECVIKKKGICSSADVLKMNMCGRLVHREPASCASLCATTATSIDKFG
jgi:hypothetical protein